MKEEWSSVSKHTAAATLLWTLVAHHKPLFTATLSLCSFKVSFLEGFVSAEHNHLLHARPLIYHITLPRVLDSKHQNSDLPNH
jgi:hypothetical protein